MRPITVQHGIKDWFVPTGSSAGAERTQLRIAKVTKPMDDRGDHFVITDTNERFIAMPLSPVVGTNYGMWRNFKVDNHIPGEDQSGPLDNFTRTDTRDVFAVVGFIDGRIHAPVILGYMPSQVNQLNGENISMVDRHHTDHVKLILKDGRTADYSNDLSGTSRGPDNLDDDPWAHDPGNGGPPNFDFKDMPWKITKTDDNGLSMTTQKGRGRMRLWADGRISIQQDNNTFLQIHQSGDVSVTSQGKVVTNAPTVTLNAATTHCNGDLHVTGTILATTIIAPFGTVPGPPADAGGSTPPKGPVVMPDVQKTWHT